MISPEYTLEDDYLIIKSKGARKNFHDIALANMEMVKEIEKYNPNRILLDHRELIYNVNQSDALNLVRLYEKNKSKFEGIKVACCVQERFMQLGNLWEDIGQKRGFIFKAFTDIDEAKKWLRE